MVDLTFVRRLAHRADPAWPDVQGWIDEANVGVEVVARTPAAAEAVKLQLGVSRRSVLGAIVWETGGLVVDDGWLRLFGSGGPRMPSTLATWNGIGPRAVRSDLQALVVGADVLGGFFALDGGAFSAADGAVWYLAPDTGEWEPLGMGFAAFVEWALTGDLAEFAADQRWPGWRAAVAATNGDDGVVVDPLPWEREAAEAQSFDVEVVALRELWRRQRRRGVRRIRPLGD